MALGISVYFLDELSDESLVSRDGLKFRVVCK